jgi:hypothetical protein
MNDSYLSHKERFLKKLLFYCLLLVLQLYFVLPFHHWLPPGVLVLLLYSVLIKRTAFIYWSCNFWMANQFGSLRPTQPHLLFWTIYMLWIWAYIYIYVNMFSKNDEYGHPIQLLWMSFFFFFWFFSSSSNYH